MLYFKGMKSVFRIPIINNLEIREVELKILKEFHEFSLSLIA